MILILGAPGSGKGTQTLMLENTGLFKVYSLGQLLRENALSNPSVRESMQKGELVDQAVIDQVLLEALRDYPADGKAVVLDGHPRSIAQFDWLFSDDNPNKVIGAIHLVAPEEVLRARLMLRAQNSGRIDDNIATIENRFRVYKEDSLPVIDKFINSGIKVVEVNADQPVERVHQDCLSAAKELFDANQNQD